jgi:hypothetical protein
MNSEPLANLARIGLLDPVPFSAALMQKMLHVAQSSDMTSIPSPKG